MTNNAAFPAAADRALTRTQYHFAAGRLFPEHFGPKDFQLANDTVFYDFSGYEKMENLKVMVEITTKSELFDNVVPAHMEGVFLNFQYWKERPYPFFGFGDKYYKDINTPRMPLRLGFNQFRVPVYHNLTYEWNCLPGSPRVMRVPNIVTTPPLK